MEKHGVEVEKFAVEANWQAARIENANRTLKHVWAMTCDEHQLAGKDGQLMAVVIGTASYNSLAMPCRASAF